MRAVKILVVLMGVAIVAGLTVVAVTIFSRSARLGGETPAVGVVADGVRTDGPGAERSGADGFGTMRVAVPAGAEIGEATSDGRHLIVRLRLPDGTVRFQVVDLVTGRALGRLEFAPEGP